MDLTSQSTAIAPALDDYKWRPVGRKYTTTIIVERIQRLLDESQLRRGSKLPPERELAVQMQVSRSCLREALLKALTLMGVLESRVADGTYVRSSASTGIADSLQSSILLRDKTSFLELIEARVHFECDRVRLATQKLNRKKLAAMERELAILNSLVQTVETFNEHDTKFHLLIAEPADNDIMLSFARVLQRMASATRQKTAYRYDLTKTCCEHGEIVNQMRAPQRRRRRCSHAETPGRRSRRDSRDRLRGPQTSCAKQEN